MASPSELKKQCTKKCEEYYVKFNENEKYFKSASKSSLWMFLSDFNQFINQSNEVNQDPFMARVKSLNDNIARETRSAEEPGKTTLRQNQFILARFVLLSKNCPEHIKEAVEDAEENQPDDIIMFCAQYFYKTGHYPTEDEIEQFKAWKGERDMQLYQDQLFKGSFGPIALREKCDELNTKFNNKAFESKNVSPLWMFLSDFNQFINQSNEVNQDPFMASVKILNSKIVSETKKGKPGKTNLTENQFILARFVLLSRTHPKHIKEAVDGAKGKDLEDIIMFCAQYCIKTGKYPSKYKIGLLTKWKGNKDMQFYQGSASRIIKWSDDAEKVQKRIDKANMGEKVFKLAVSLIVLLIVGLAVGAAFVYGGPIIGGIVLAVAALVGGYKAYDSRVKSTRASSLNSNYDTAGTQGLRRSSSQQPQHNAPIPPNAMSEKLADVMPAGIAYDHLEGYRGNTDPLNRYDSKTYEYNRLDRNAAGKNANIYSVAHNSGSADTGTSVKYDPGLYDYNKLDRSADADAPPTPPAPATKSAADVVKQGQANAAKNKSKSPAVRVSTKYE
jgi:hypothetical protein